MRRVALAVMALGALMTAPAEASVSRPAIGFWEPGAESGVRIADTPSLLVERRRGRTVISGLIAETPCQDGPQTLRRARLSRRGTFRASQPSIGLRARGRFVRGGSRVYVKVIDEDCGVVADERLRLTQRAPVGTGQWVTTIAGEPIRFEVRSRGRQVRFLSRQGFRHCGDPVTPLLLQDRPIWIRPDGTFDDGGFEGGVTIHGQLGAFTGTGEVVPRAGAVPAGCTPPPGQFFAQLIRPE